MKNRNKLFIRNLAGRGERGITLVESLVAIAILGGGILTLVLAMSSGALAVKENDRQSVAQGLVRAQLEYTKNYAYDPSAVTYPTVSAPAGYAVTVEVSFVPGADTDIQKIAAKVSYEGEVVMTAEDFKVNR